MLFKIVTKRVLKKALGAVIPAKVVSADSDGRPSPSFHFDSRL
jgi:hypothetical protein